MPAQVVHVVSDDSGGSRLQVDGRDFMVFGMNWGYMPIGQNYTYSLWDQPDDFIKAALAREMPLLQDMGVNTIRQYVGIPPRWVQYIYETLRHLHGAQPPDRALRADHRRRLARQHRLQRSRGCARPSRPRSLALVDEFQDTPGRADVAAGQREQLRPVLVVLRDRGPARGRAQRGAGALPLLAVRRDHPTTSSSAIPTARWPSPTATCSTSTSSPRSARDLDIFGTQRLPRHLGARPLPGGQGQAGHPGHVHRVRRRRLQRQRPCSEDQATQARYLLGQWQEIYEQSAGKGRVGNAIGGMIFQWSDGWWKFRQESRLDIHDTNASWPNGGYPEDYREGENNMNEEWWGITAKGFPDARGLYDVYPRAAYYALRDAFKLDPYAPGTDLDAIRAHFGGIRPAWARCSRPAATRPALQTDAAEQGARVGRAHGVRDLQHRRQEHHHAAHRDARRPSYPVLPGLRPRAVVLRRRRGQAQRRRHRHGCR